jgi:membrane protein
MKANFAAATSSRIVERRHFRSMWKLGGLTPWQLTRNAIRQIDEDDLLGRASGLAFNFLLALFPLIFFMLGLFGLFASRSSMLENQLLYYFADLLPPAAFELLKTTTYQLAVSPTGGKLTLGILVALWFASGGVASMISTLNVVYRVRETRSWIRVRAMALALTLAISILLLCALIIVLAGSRLFDLVGAQSYLGSPIALIWKALEWPTALLFVIISFSSIYYFGPDRPDRYWHWITPGSLFGVFLWFAASATFRVYLHFFNTYDATYGSLGAVMILLVWLYVAGLAFLIGGEINAEIERAARTQSSARNRRVAET